MISLNPCEFRSRITFQTLVPVVNEATETTQVPKDLFTTFAKLNPVKPMTTKGGEFMEDQKEFPELIYQVFMWYHSGITTDMLIAYGTRKFQIIGVRNPEERNVYLILDCIEKVKA